MKKLLAITAAALLAFSVGCSKDEAEPKKKEEAKPAAATEKKDETMAEKQSLLAFEGDLVLKLRSYHAAFNAYAAGLEKEGEDALPKADLDKLKADAKASGEKAVAEIPSIEVPSDLTEDHQAAAKGALEELKKSYEARVAGLEDEAKATEADTLFTSFQDKLNSIHEDLKLIPGNFDKEL
jgi:hypothetical protein